MPENPVTEFLVAACVPLHGAHASGTLEQANALLAAHPELAAHNIYVAAVLGDGTAVRQFLHLNPNQATAKGGPHQWDPLTYLCFSRYLRLDPNRSTSFVQTAKLLLDAGAIANTGFFSSEHQPQPTFESVLYGAAGVAHNADLTRLLLEHGADPNDEEVPYHAPENWDRATLEVLVSGGRLTPDSLATMLLRKADWHDFDGIKYLLEHGAEPNRRTHWGFTALHQALRRDNSIQIIALLLEHGADPTIQSDNPTERRSAISIAARRGRGDALELFESRGFSLQLQDLDRLIAACARNNAAEARSLLKNEPALREGLRAQAGTLLGNFAGNGNTPGVRLLLELGIPIGAVSADSDPYFDVARNSTALHVAAWRARHDTVQLLLERGADVNARDAKGRTPLAVAVKACVDSYWQARRSPESVRLLLQAGASIAEVPYPCGYAAVDELLQAHGAGA